LCRYRDEYFNVGSRTDNRDTFLCLSKEKYPKETTPGCRLFPALLAFGEGFRKGHPWPSENERHPCRSPIGLITPKHPVLGAAYGRKTILNSKVISLQLQTIIVS